MLRTVYQMMGAHPPADQKLMLIDLVEWLLRLPTRSPRQVHKSWALRKQVLTPLEISGVNQILMCLEFGGDLRPFLGTATRAIRQRNKEVPKIGPSLRNKRLQPDWLFSDWGIHHFHLGPDLEAKGKKVLRSARVLFAYLTNDDAYLLEVLAHKLEDEGVVWADKRLLETLCREWPSVMDRYELRGALAPAAVHSTSSSEMHELRRAGANTAVIINGKAYMGPGMGLASDRSSTRAVRLSGEICKELNQMEKLFRNSPEHAKARLFIEEDASVGFFIPSRNTAICCVPARTSQCRMIWFFQRLLQEVPIFQGAPADGIWLAPDTRRRNLGA
jgi:hypothetical protein